MSSWSSLSSIDKQAFYSILDEYFESRPHLFQNNSSSSNNNNNNNNNNPSRLISNIISSSKPSNQPNSNGNSNNQDSPFKTIGMVSSLMNHNNNNNNNNNNNGSNGQSQVNPLSAASKIHSLSQSFNQSNNNNNNSNPKPPVSNRHTPSGLASSQKFFGGMVSQSEKDAANAKPRGILAEAAASANQKITNNNNNNNNNNKNKNFLPPPTRTNTQPVKKLINQSNLDIHDDDSELVEAIYDYSGTSPEDLSFKEHQIIKVTEHISDDWWNGQIDDGPIGMFPSSYVKPI